MLDYISAFNYIIYVIHIFWHVCIICLYVYVHIYKSISRLEKTIVSRIQISIYMFVYRKSLHKQTDIQYC